MTMAGLIFGNWSYDSRRIKWEPLNLPKEEIFRRKKQQLLAELQRLRRGALIVARELEKTIKEHEYEQTQTNNKTNSVADASVSGR
jgi:hypothetical protein